MPLSAVERFVLAHILYEYGGKLYIASSGEEPEETLAGFLAEDFLPSSDRRYTRVREAFKGALVSLRDKWMIEVRGYEAILTPVGRREAEKLSREEYENLRERFSSR